MIGLTGSTQAYRNAATRKKQSIVYMYVFLFYICIETMKKATLYT
jgi:hypothetical protein